jgi:PAS domain S-box-containing protein
MRDLTIVSSSGYRPGTRDKTIEFMDRLELLDLLEAIVTRAGQLLGTADGYIYVIEPTTHTLEVKVGVGLFKEQVGLHLPLPPETAASLWPGDHLLVEDYNQWPGRLETIATTGPRRLLAVPLKSATEVMGVLCLLFYETITPLTSEELRLLERFAELASLALEIALDNARLYLSAQQELAERQRAEAALRQSEERFRKIFEEGPFGMALIGLDQCFTRANPAFCQMLGYSEAELTGLTFSELTHPEDQGLYNHLAEQMMQGEIPFYKIQKRYLRKNGEVVWANLTRSMIRDSSGAPLYSLAMLEDITERKRAEDERDRFFTLSSDMLFIGSLDGYFRQVNNAWQKTLGYTPAELLSIPFVELIHPENLRSAVREMQSLGNDSGTLHYELRLRHRDGSYRWTSWAVTPYSQEGLIYGIGRDITERKLAEEALRMARDELEQRVTERTAELEAANEEIRSFAYIVSHDLRAPLINLRGFAAELKRAARTINDHIAPALLHLDENSRYELGSALQEDIPEALDFINAAVSRMDRLTSAILSLSRLGRRELSLEPIEMNLLVRETLDSLAHQVEQSEAEVTLGELPTVTADRTAMEQIMGNLLANAVTYLVPGRPGHIDIRGERHELETLFHVCDNGRGIAAADLPKLFQPFSRLGEPVAPGEGMGLAYVQTLVRRHGGRITCESAPGVGTTFTFTISHRLNQEDKDG